MPVRFGSVADLPLPKREPRYLIRQNALEEDGRRWLLS